MVYGLVATYGLVKFSIMVERRDTNFQTETKKYAVDPGHEYTAADLGFDFYFTVMGVEWSA